MQPGQDRSSRRAHDPGSLGGGEAGEIDQGDGSPLLLGQSPQPEVEGLSVERRQGLCLRVVERLDRGHLLPGHLLGPAGPMAIPAPGQVQADRGQPRLRPPRPTVLLPGPECGEICFLDQVFSVLAAGHHSTRDVVHEIHRSHRGLQELFVSHRFSSLGRRLPESDSPQGRGRCGGNSARLPVVVWPRQRTCMFAREPGTEAQFPSRSASPRFEFPSKKLIAATTLAWGPVYRTTYKPFLMST